MADQDTDSGTVVGIDDGIASEGIAPVEGSPEGTQPKAEDMTEKRVADTEAALKDKQRELHDTTEAIAKVKADMDGFMEGIEAQKQALVAQDKAPEQDWLDSDALAEALDSDPAAANKQMIRLLRNEFSDLVVGLKDSITEERNAQIASATDPEKARLQPVIDKLSEQGWFTSLDGAAQLEAARNFEAVSPKAKPAPEPSVASPGGTGRSAARAPKTDEYQKQIEARASALFGGIRDEDPTMITVAEV